MNFKELLERRRVEYQSHTPLYCPVLGKEVVFGMDGFHHIRFGKKSRERPLVEQVIRLTLLACMRIVISLATDFQYRRRGDVQYWGLEIFVGDARIRVVLKKKKNRAVRFWSIMHI